MSTCFFCKGKLEHKLVNHIVDLDDTIIIVKGVPAARCPQCGKVSYSNDVTMRLEEIVNSMKDQHLEVAIFHYTGRAI